MTQSIKYLLLGITFFLFQLNSIGQNQTIDSLKLALKNAQHDTTRCNILSVMIEAESDDNIWPKYNDELKNISEKNIGKGRLFKEIYLKHLASALNNIGFIYNYKGDIPNALDYYHRSLKLKEEIGDKKGISTSFNNIGLIIYYQGDLSKALEYFLKSLKLKEEIGDKNGIANSLNNIGSIYDEQGKINKAMEYYVKCLKIQEEIGSKKGIALSYNNIGFLYNKQAKFSKALEYYYKSLKLREEINDMEGVATTLSNIAKCMIVNGQTSDALFYAKRAMEASKELGFPENIKSTASSLKVIYLKQKKYKDAFEMYELEIKMRDSINNEVNQKASLKKQLQYDYAKKELVTKAEQDKKDVIANEEKQKQQIITNAISTGFIIVLILGLFILRGFRQKQKANLIITQQKIEVETQKKLVDEKHKEITDSINYAERIQRSFLATTELLNESLNDYFVFFQPKDVVSGDFYWASKIGSSSGAENFILVTADSTGHGVPGAIMSLLNITSLEKAIEHCQNPSDILNATRKTIIERLKKDGSSEGGKDGMDASLVCFDFNNSKLIYAAANNPVWVVRKNELIELKPDKMPVGKHDKDSQSFTQHEFEVQKDDVVYALTDGMPDQFGGSKGKKFMYKKLKELLISIASLPMQKQKETLQISFDNWRGDLEQVDDVTVIGIRI